MGRFQAMMLLPNNPGGIAALSAMALACSCTAPEPTSAERFSANGQLVALSGAGAGAQNACFTCHGLRGEGDGAGTPRLAGLHAGYMLRQLEAYADGRRKHPQMRWIARNLSPIERKRVADYYGAMSFAVEGIKAASVPSLYAQGDPRRGLPACASCHGFQGEGLGPAFPPLAGQPAPYLADQLIGWRQGNRYNDPGNMMLRISQLLTPAEIEALAAYARTLPGDLPGRESREAFPATRRADPRNDVSERLLHVPESARAAE